MIACINTSHPTFKALQRKYNVKSEHLELIMKQYPVENEPYDSAAMEAFIEDKLGLSGMYYGDDYQTAHDLWEKKNPTEVFKSKSEATFKKNELVDLFTEDGVEMYQNDEGWIVKIKEPVEHKGFTLEMDNILRNAPRNSEGKLLVSPNGPVSNLNERQYAQVRTKAFKEWFGDWQNPTIGNVSKVVDENGEPLVVYNTNSRPGITDPISIYSQKDYDSILEALSHRKTYNGYTHSPMDKYVHKFNGEYWLTTSNPNSRKNFFNAITQLGFNQNDFIIQDNGKIVQISDSRDRDSIAAAKEIANTVTNTAESKQIEDILTFLNKKIGVQYKYISEKEARDILGYLPSNMKAFNKDGTAYFIKGRNISTDIASEEMLHPLTVALSITDSLTYSNLVREAKEKYPTLWSNIRASYKREDFKSEAEYLYHLNNEIVTQALSREFSKERKEHPDGRRISEFLQEFIDWFKNLFSIRDINLGEFTLSDFAKALNSDININSVIKVKGVFANQTTEKDYTSWNDYFLNFTKHIVDKSNLERKDKIVNTINSALGKTPVKVSFYRSAEVLINRDNIIARDEELSQIIMDTAKVMEAGRKPILYTYKGKKRIYGIEGSHIYTTSEREVFKSDSKDRRKVFANLAIQEKRAVVVTHNNKQYVVNKRDQIISVTTGNEIKWSKENSDRKAILKEAAKKFNTKLQGVTKIISGGQTGVDTIGLQVGRELGIETGGTAPKGYIREKGYDNEDIASYGLKEISDEDQADYTKRTGKKDPYTARTEQNVRNSDGTVYFSSDKDSAGKTATKRAADQYDKPFLENPTAEELREWIEKNNIKTLNVAGNRGSKLDKNNNVASILREALGGERGDNEELTPEDTIQAGSSGFFSDLSEIIDRDDMALVEEEFGEGIAMQSAVIEDTFEEEAEPIEPTKDQQAMVNMRNSDKEIHIDAIERKFLANNIMTLTSMVITALNSDRNAARNLLGESYGVIDYTKISREQLIKEIGLDTIFGVVLDKFYDPYSDLNENAAGYSDEIADKLEFVKENWSAFLKEGYSKLISLEGISVVLNSSEQVKQGDIDEAMAEQDADALSEKEREHWQIGFRQISARSSLSQAIKRTFEGLKVYQTINGEKVVLTDKYGYGFEQFVDSGRAVNSVLEWTKDCLSVEEMEEVLKDKVSTNPWVQSVLDEMQNEPFRSMFYNNFRKDFTTYGNVIERVDDDDRKYYEVQILNENTALKTAINDISSKFKNKLVPALMTVGRTGKRVVNHKGVKVMLNNIETLTNLFQKMYATTPRNFYATVRDNLKNIQKILSDIGIEVDLNTLNQALVIRKLKPNAQDNPAFKMLSEIKNLLNAADGYTGDDFKPLTKGSESNLYNYYSAILNPLLQYMSDSIEASMYENGKMYYAFNTPSYLNKMSKSIRGEKGQEYIEKEYGYSRWFKDNDGKWRTPWLKLLMASKKLRSEFKTKVELNFNGSDYTELSPLSYAKSLIAEYFAFDKSKTDKDSAWFRVPILSNKPSSEFIKFKRYTGDRATYQARIISGFKQIALQEVTRFQSVLETLGDRSIERIKNYDINDKALKKTDKYKDLLRKTKDEKTALEQTKQYYSDAVRNRTLTRDDIVKSNGLLFAQSGASFKFISFLNDEIVNGTELGNMIVDKIAGRDIDEAKFDALFKESSANNMRAIVQEELNNFRKLGMFNMRNNEYTDLPFQVQTLTEYARANGLRMSDYNMKDPKQAQEYYDERKKYIQQRHNDVLLKLEEYVWNDMYATMNIIQMTTTDLAYYKDSEDFQKRIAQIHSPTMKLNKTAKMEDGTLYSDGKVRTMYIADNIVESELIPEVEAIFNEKIAEAKTASDKKRITEMKNSIIEGFKEVNVADAQAYSSPTSYRKKLAMMGKWTPQMEKAYQRIRHGDFDVDDLGVVWQPLKPFVYTTMNKARSTQSDSAMSSARVPVQMKNSEYMLLMAGALMSGRKNSKLGAIFDFMEESAYDGDNYNKSGIDTIQFESAIKVGLMGVIDLNKAKSYKEAKEMLENAAYLSSSRDSVNGDRYNSNFVHTFDVDDYGIQQEVPAHLIDHNQAMGSQVRVLIAADFKDTDLSATGRPMNELRDEYMELLGDNIRDSYDRLLETFKGETEAERKKNLEKVLQETILNDQKYGSEMLKACSLEDGEFVIPLDDPIQAVRIQQLLNSIIKSRINKQKTAGGPIVQVSSFGLDKDLHIVFAGEGKNRHVEHFECMITCPSIQLEQAMTVYENGKPRLMSIEEAIKAKILTEDSPFLTAIGYRIPTEGFHSMAPLKVVGFLPRSAGEGIMLPKEITLLSGSDFDVDKMYIMRKHAQIKTVHNYDKLKEDFINKMSETHEDIIGEINAQNKLTSSKQGKKAQEQDKFQQWIDMTIDRLNNGFEFTENTPEKALADMYNMNRNKYDSVKTVVDSGTLNRKGRDNRIFDLQMEMLQSHAVLDKMFNPGSFDVQKKTSRIIRVLSETKTNYTYKQLERKSIGELDEILAGNSAKKNIIRPSSQVAFHQQNMTAGKLIGIFANNNTAHAFMTDMNISLKNLGNGFIINGIHIADGQPVDGMLGFDGSYVSKNISSFLAASVDAVKDPVLNYMNLNTFTSGPAMVLARLGFDSDTIGLIMSQPVIKEMAEKYMYLSNNGYTAPKQIVIDTIIGGMPDGNKILRNLRETLYNTDFTKEALAENIKHPDDNFRDQTAMLFLNLLEIAKDMQEATYLTKFNSVTNASGPTLGDVLEARLRIQRFKDRINDEESGEARLSIEAAQIFDKNDLLNAFHTTTIDEYGAIKYVFNDFFQNSDEFMGILSDFERYTGNKLQADEINKIFYEYMLYRMTATDMLDGSQKARMEFIKDFPARFLKEIKGKIDNELINALQLKESDMNVPVDTIDCNTGSMTTDQRDSISNAWSMLMKNPETRNLAMDLFKYNLYRNGMAFSPKTFINLASVELRQEMDGYIDSIRELLNPKQGTVRLSNIEFIVQYLRNHTDSSYLFYDDLDMREMKKGEDGKYYYTGNPKYEPNGYVYMIDSDTLLVRGKLGRPFTPMKKLGIKNNFLEYDARVSNIDMKSVFTEEERKFKGTVDGKKETTNNPEEAPSRKEPKKEGMYSGKDILDAQMKTLVKIFGREVIENEIADTDGSIKQITVAMKKFLLYNMNKEAYKSHFNELNEIYKSLC